MTVRASESTAERVLQPEEGFVLVTLAQQGSGSSAGFVLTLALMLGAMYLLIIRPQRKRMRAVLAVQSALVPGVDVVLTSGIYGTTVNVDQDDVLLEVAPGVHIKVAKGAVARVVSPEPITANPDGASAD